MYRYYLTQRGPGPGCQPKGANWTGDYAIKKFVEEIGRKAWGYAEYDRQLTAKQIEEYELVEVGTDLILGDYKGCGACILCEEGIDCKKIHVPVEITFKKAQKADDWGRFVTVFSKDEKVTGKAVIRDNKVYCASAKSNIYEEYEDFISLENVEIKRIE